MARAFHVPQYGVGHAVGQNGQRDDEQLCRRDDDVARSRVTAQQGVLVGLDDVIWAVQADLLNRGQAVDICGKRSNDQKVTYCQYFTVVSNPICFHRRLFLTRTDTWNN